MNAPACYTLHGLTVASHVPLGAERAAPEGVPPDLTVRLGPGGPATVATPEGRLLLDFETDQRWYSLVRRADSGWCFRVYGVCDFEVSPDLTEVVLHPAADMTPGMEPVMVTGTLMALQLYLRGDLVLHASAVDLDGTAVAFVGHSGMGKSTMATLLCAGGAGAVVTDDVLRVGATPDGAPTARLGSRELRLRPGAESLAGLLGPGAGRRTSADRRDVLTPAGEAADGLPLRALVVPRADRQATAVEVTRLAPVEAMLAVLSFPRLMGWRDPEVLGRLFGQVGAVVERVPVLVAQVPWGPPFAPDLPARLRAALGSALG